jgi:hypothetical protein
VNEVPFYVSLREGRDDEEARDLQEELHELLDRL